MTVAPLTYNYLSRTAVKTFEKTNGALLIELTASRGQFLLSVLERRDNLERSLLLHQPTSSLLWHHFVYSVALLNLRLFHKHLLSVIEYLSYVNMSHGWDINKDGNFVFLFTRLPPKAP